MNTDKFETMFHHPSFGIYSAHEVALDGFADYEEAVDALMDCEIGDTVEDDFGEEWRRVA